MSFSNINKQQHNTPRPTTVNCPPSSFLLNSAKFFENERETRAQKHAREEGTHGRRRNEAKRGEARRDEARRGETCEARRGEARISLLGSAFPERPRERRMQGGRMLVVLRTRSSARGSCALTRCNRDTVRFARVYTRGRGRGERSLSSPLYCAPRGPLNGGFAGGQTTVPWDGSARHGSARLDGVVEASQASSPASLDAQPAYKTMDSLECIQREREREGETRSRARTLTLMACITANNSRTRRGIAGNVDGWMRIRATTISPLEKFKRN